MQINTVPLMTIADLRRAIPVITPSLTMVIQSEPGCGKTSLLAMVAEDMGDHWRKPGDDYPDDRYDYIYVDCPVKDMQDIGMVVPNHEKQSLEYYVASLFKMGSGKPKFIFLDELLKAPKMLQVIFTRLMLERMIGDVPLPKGSMVAATSNNASDGVGDTMLAHAGNRVCRVEMKKPDHDEWGLWAAENNIHRSIRTFVALTPRCLNSYRDGGQENNEFIFKPNMGTLSFVSPRSLAKSDVIVRNRDVFGPQATQAMLAGTIGAAAAAQMSALMAMDKSLDDVKDIVRDPDNISVPDDIAAQLMIMLQAVDTLDNHDDLEKFMVWVNRVPSAEVQSIFFTQMVRTPRASKLARRNEAIKNWCIKNHVLL